MKKALCVVLLGLLGLVSFGPGTVQAEVKEYAVPTFCDFSGPYADLMKITVPAREAIFKWWNEKEGKKLGVKLVPKNYDTRYDATVVASMWPGILAKKPVIVAGLGGTDVSALQQRLPRDKVPVIYSTASYGFGWLPNQWIFQPRPTYTQEQLGALSWYIQTHPEKRPVKVAFMTTQASPAYIDIVSGIKHYVNNVLAPKGLAEVVSEQWIELQPVDVSSQLKQIVEKKADLIFGIANTAMAAALIRAEQVLGVNIPTISAPHHSIWPLAMAMKSYNLWEGHYVAGSVVSSAEKDGPAYQYFKTLQETYKLSDKTWSPFGMLGLTQGILMARIVEHAAKKVGPSNLTGEVIYNTMFDQPFTEQELMGILPTQRFGKDAPFATKDLKVKITTVKDGKYQLATPGWVDVPSDIVKW
ncbi:MAG: ABC transporter substrate-binding protein [Desulfatiglans sp.]|jgi:branched-chain amino acid transport system substrate-binding protein|nr:ABC transporter substrate-binding protein [Thermodesulfobacteriota bacterium]MEE4353380.1 ABC transporter substrate-binding protein [Desulfatiglans sp.]